MAELQQFSAFFLLVTFLTYFIGSTCGKYIYCYVYIITRDCLITIVSVLAASVMTYCLISMYLYIKKHYKFKFCIGNTIYYSIKLYRHFPSVHENTVS